MRLLPRCARLLALSLTAVSCLLLLPDSDVPLATEAVERAARSAFGWESFESRAIAWAKVTWEEAFLRYPIRWCARHRCCFRFTRS